MVAFGGEGKRKAKCAERVCEKMQPVTMATVAQNEKIKKKTPDKEKISHTSPKPKASGSQSLQPSPKVKPIFKALLNSQFEKDNDKIPQKSPLTKSENVTGVPLRFSPRVKAINQSVSEKSPNVKEAGADDVENNNVKTNGSDIKVLTKLFYASTTRSKAIDEGSLKRRKNTENEPGKKQIEHASTNKESEAGKQSEVKIFYKYGLLSFESNMLCRIEYSVKIVYATTCIKRLFY